MIFSTKTKLRILKKYLHRFEREHVKYITDYKNCHRTAANIIILQKLINSKIYKKRNFNIVTPIGTQVEINPDELKLGVKVPSHDELKSKGITVDIIITDLDKKNIQEFQRTSNDNKE